MTSGAWFIALVFALVGGLLVFHKGNPVTFLRANPGAAKGIAIAVLTLTGIILLGGCTHGRFATEAVMFGGIEYTKKQSPMCDPGRDDKGTSNLGFALTAWESHDGRTKAQARYTHHSCFIGSDWMQYDAFGVHLTRQVWAR
ncbi:MAG: hypothetical protein ACTS5I_16950 [Rhodanobacter sp.]